MSEPREKVEVTLDPELQARILQQMREEQAARFRTRHLRRFVLLPAVLAVLWWSVDTAVNASGMESLLANLVASLLLWYLWRVRRSLPAFFGFK